MKPTQGSNSKVKVLEKAMEQRRANKREFKRNRWREIMLESEDPQKVIHAAVRWYGTRAEWETPPSIEFPEYSRIVHLLAQYSPEWVAREFPASKDYKSPKGFKNYFTCMEALHNAEPFNGDVDKVNSFLWSWGNWKLSLFLVAGMTLLDELSINHGEPTFMDVMEWELGTPGQGRSKGLPKKSKPRPKHLKLVK